ncbi:hypothetical protein TR13x_00815 [Caloranaerobacter sp. TR13]|uniref:nucleotide exchange factor GrpE n=1 Tax=Caloranaerobacter sp. TR13 TaxID=1302151 RepID=UPI0006D9592E|nr:nucleotide exchange factor GrpE [Caloranaerobacter sp. TR13]KPU27925.1 hypothetical protein TR13x_00815 [Caloranaerobacter sp. TR13]
MEKDLNEKEVTKEQVHNEEEKDMENEKKDSNDATEESKEDNIDELKEKLEGKMRELEELNNRFLRLQADFLNYKKRVEKEKESIYAYASEELICQVLPVIDNFERALDSVNDSQKEDSFYKGIEMVYKQLLDILKKSGLEEIKAIGEKFDPNLHHGVAQEESSEHEEDTIIEVYQKGYKLKDKVIRPSMVKISK